MAGKCLDSNVVIAVIEEDPRVLQHLRPSVAVYVPLVVLGELLYGAENSARPAANRRRIERAFFDIELLLPDIGTAQLYASIRAQLKRAGTSIPDNDIWIAATAMQHDLTLVTRDAHFDQIESLPIETWG